MKTIGVIVTVYLLIGLFTALFEIFVYADLYWTEWFKNRLSEIRSINNMTIRIVYILLLAYCFIITVLIWPTYIQFYIDVILEYVLEKVRNK